MLAQPILAIAFGAFFLCAETCLHLGDIMAPSSWVELPIYDWIAGGLLVHAGISTRRNSQHGRAWLAAAWAFMASLLTGAFIGHWEEWEEWTTSAAPSDQWIPPGVFLAIIAMLLMVSVAALGATLRLKSTSPAQEVPGRRL